MTNDIMTDDGFGEEAISVVSSIIGDGLTNTAHEDVENTSSLDNNDSSPEKETQIVKEVQIVHAG